MPEHKPIDERSHRVYFGWFLDHRAINDRRMDENPYEFQEQPIYHQRVTIWCGF